MAKTQNATSSFPKVGNKAPKFSAQGAGGQTIRLESFRGDKVVVLYFYPKDDTPGCTKEACGFRDGYGKLQRAGIEVIGVSPDSAASHEKFIAKYELPFTLVADEDKKICEAYGVWQEKKRYGRTYMGVVRTTFVIDKEGTLVHIFETVKPDGHEDEVLGWIQENL